MKFCKFHVKDEVFSAKTLLLLYFQILERLSCVQVEYVRGATGSRPSGWGGCQPEHSLLKPRPQLTTYGFSETLGLLTIEHYNVHRMVTTEGFLDPS